MDTNIDLLKIKIDKARSQLSEESRRAIDSVDWKNVILSMRAEKGYSFEQLEDLETETELLLCGLILPEDYPKELEKRLSLPRAQVEALVNEMNEKVFKKIREELEKILGNTKNEESPSEVIAEGGMGIEEEMKKLEETPEIQAPKLEQKAKVEIKPEAKPEQKTETADMHSILMQKLSASFQMPKVETEHSLNNLSKSSETPISKSDTDPYREPIQ